MLTLGQDREAMQTSEDHDMEFKRKWERLKGHPSVIIRCIYGKLLDSKVLLPESLGTCLLWTKHWVSIMKTMFKLAVAGYNASDEVIRWQMQRWPDATETKTKKGNSPLVIPWISASPGHRK